MTDDKTVYLRPPLNGIGIGDYTLRDFAAKWMMQQDDIAEVRKYSAANELLKTAEGDKPRVVMLGDSITEFWEFPTVSGFSLINRGIAGQNSSQMLLRFEDDVVALSPFAVVLLCGTNDLRAYVGAPASVSASALVRISRNVRAMADIAKANSIRVLLCALPPVGSDSERVSRSSEGIRNVNRWLEEFAHERGYPFADFHSALADLNGFLPEKFGEDGVHPNKSGYGQMWPALKSAITTLV
jgi:lysophospholipase L1-like esterase